MTKSATNLRRLARLMGIQTAFEDVTKKRRQASGESLIAVIRALGVDVDSDQAAAAQLADFHKRTRTRSIEPVIVSWEGRPTELDLWLPSEKNQSFLRCTITAEDGEQRMFDVAAASLAECPAGEGNGSAVCRRLQLPELPLGYHKLTLENGNERHESTVLAAPKRAWLGETKGPDARTWGSFLPLYAMRTARNWGCGDYTDLGHLREWVSENGGRMIGTLPLLSGFFDEPCDPSPYRPLSRRFWNEFFIDVDAVPELADCAPAKELLASADVARDLESFRAAEHVEYHRIAMLKRRVLEMLADHFFQNRTGRYARLRESVEREPQLERYARFRAACDKYGANWAEWPERLRDGAIEDSDVDERTKNYYLYSQWIADEQVEAACGGRSGDGAGLYLDLPLGVRQDGFDPWHYRNAFVPNMSAGAPPDSIFTRGQNWGFSPIHPEGLREHNYDYLIDLLRHHMRSAKLLRIDHVMGLHRLYWIPDGMGADKGVYVHYRAEELYAVLNLESHRHRVPIVGENLGTVPSYVNRAMDRHRIQRMCVVQYEYQPGKEERLERVARGSVASLNTHDMPTFAAYWKGDDIADRQDLGLLTEDEAEGERQQRATVRQALLEWIKSEKLAGDDGEPSTRKALEGCLKFLAESDARVLLVNLEDLWLETKPQNVPGTCTERPNWLRKARMSFEEFRQDPEVINVLKEIDRLRRKERQKPVRTQQTRGHE